MPTQEIDLGNVQGPKGDTGPQGPQGAQGPEGPQGPPGEFDMDAGLSFTEATTRANINTGESLKTILGKIKKFFTDLKPHAFSNPVNNLTGTDASLPLAAPQGKALKQEIDELNSALNYFNAVDDVTGSNFQKNFWLISRNDKTSEINKNSFFVVTQTNRAEWKNIPPDMPNQTIIGMREVFVRSSQHVLVQITEFHPIAGRRYCSMYNDGLWSDWQTYNPS